MKKFLLLLSVLVAMLSTTKAQTLVTGKWRYQFVLFDSTARPPQDTLASSPVGSIAVKNGILYVKQANTFWAGVAGLVAANEGVMNNGGVVQFAQPRTAVGDPAAINDDRILPILNGSYIDIKDPVLNTHTLLDASFVRLNDSAQANYATYGSSNFFLHDLSSNAYLDYIGGILNIHDSTGLPVIQLEGRHATNPTVVAQINPSGIYLIGDEANLGPSFINITDVTDANKMFHIQRRSSAQGKSELLYGDQGVDTKNVTFEDAGDVVFKGSGINAIAKPVILDGDSSRVAIIGNNTTSKIATVQVKNIQSGDSLEFKQQNNLSTITASAPLEFSGDLYRFQNLRNGAQTDSIVVSTQADGLGKIVFASGTWTPTFADQGGISISAFNFPDFRFMRVGNVVTFSGRVGIISSNSTGERYFTFTLPPGHPIGSGTLTGSVSIIYGSTGVTATTGYTTNSGSNGWITAGATANTDMTVNVSGQYTVN